MKIVWSAVLLVLLSACSSGPKTSREVAAESREDIEKRNRKVISSNLSQKIDVIQYSKEAILCFCNKTEETPELTNQVGFLSFSPLDFTYTVSCAVPGNKPVSCNAFQVIR